MHPYSGLLVMAFLTLGPSAAANDDESATVPAEILAERANHVLGLLASNVVSLDIDRAPTLPIVANVPIAGQLLTLDLVPHSVRAPGYEIWKQIADGSFVAIEPGPVRTLRGNVVDLPDSRVAGAMEQEGLIARIDLPNGQEYWIEPAAPRVAGASPNDYVVYNRSNIIPAAGTCAADETLHRRPRLDFGAPSIAGGAACGTGTCLAQLACDADVEFFEDFGSVAGVESRINAIINLVNAQYENEVEITHEITTVLVRTAEPDPYTSTDAGTLLNQFTAEWQNNQQGIPHDVAELFTGKNMQGNTIGIAWLNAVCRPFRYNLVESNFNGINGNFSCKTDLSAHELGHNWGADHCSCSNPNFTMNPSITCVNRFHPNDTIPEIMSFRDSRGCLEGASCTTPADCDDGNPCTNDVCNAGVCSHVNNTNSCNDLDSCTSGDSCGNGSCAGKPIVCNDGDPCTNDSCNGGLCQFNSFDCDDSNGCTDDTCINGGCQHTNNANSCNDVNPCTENDTCSDGQCFGVPVDCDDGDPCTTDGCFANGCQNSSIVCNDSNPCTDDACAGGVCEFTDNNTACNDGNGCTENDVCGEGFCSGTPLNCDDGDPCTTDTCDQGFCSNTGIACNDGNPCTDDSCNANGCQFTNNQNPCNDIDLCTVADQCANGACAGDPIDCDDGEPCTDDVCNSLGGCESTPNTAPCDDGDPCTSGDICSDGACQSGKPTDCDDANPCTDEFCDSGSCVTTNNQNPCNDGLGCTANDRCSDGACVGDLLDCDDRNACTDDACDPDQSVCVNTPNSNSCEDGDPCTEGDSCENGSCIGIPFLFGDLNRSGLVDLTDILCVLDGFQGLTIECSLENDDIVGAEGACGGDDQIDLNDIIAVLNAFEGFSVCCSSGR